jgi:hypothetical protein
MRRRTFLEVVVGPNPRTRSTPGPGSTATRAIATTCGAPLGDAIATARPGGARGVSLFDSGALTDAHLAVVKEALG